MTAAHHPFDVVIIGSGPGGAAVAERVKARQPDAAVAIVERGPLLLERHFYDTGGTIVQRNDFVARHGECPWEGDLSEAGILVSGVGGRGMVGGSQLHRFYDTDLALWPAGLWPPTAAELAPYFDAAEQRLLGGKQATSGAQRLVLDTLAGLGALHPPAAEPSAPAEQARGAGAGFPHRSSVERVLTLAAARQVTLFADTTATRLVTAAGEPDRVIAVRVVGPGLPAGTADLGVGAVVLAASPVESARLVLASGLADCASGATPIGAYLAEHVYSRGMIAVPATSGLVSNSVNIFLPPPGDDLYERFQLEVRSMPNSDPDFALLRITGSAAMDPVPANRVTLADSTDSVGVRRATTVMTYSDDDRRRITRMLAALDDVRGRLGGSWVDPVTVLPRGASYHEAGTLRIGVDAATSAADVDGLLRGTTNVYTGDGAAFPSVGAANPTLTITAMGYRLGDHLGETLGGSSFSA
jgi:choline dehydrogenase-like flavoprotein